MTDNKFERCEPDDPRRCQTTIKHGQCPYKAVDGTKFCQLHKGAMQANEIQEEKDVRNYRITKWQTRINEFADNTKVKSLREEVGILRIVLEEILCMCKNKEEILLYSGKITDTVLKIEKVVSSCHRLEASTGALLDKTAALHLASTIVEVITKHITDEDIIDSISNEIIQSIMSIQSKVATKAAVE